MSLTRRDFLRLNVSRVSSVSADNPDHHLLNRITWGPRPEEMARIAQIGRESYIDEQLNPESLENSEQHERLVQRYPILNMDRRTLYRIREYDRLAQPLIGGTIWRAVYSKHQLYERMVDFWTDHFNVPLGQSLPDLISYQETVIRKHALGSFYDLLLATAKAPAMLVYLDNYVNFKDHPNENYSRELLELHTMGVDGGYTQDDVEEVARAFTGWTTHDRTRSGFYFYRDEHDYGSKQILGHRFPADRGIEDGLHVLGVLARHPSTAQFICTKLARKFVSDNPPQSLIDSTANVFLQSEGDIRTVMRHLLLSAEFAQSAGQKYRRPLDFFVGALRATGTEVTSFRIFEEMIAQLGQTPFNWHPPDGYPDMADVWTNTGGTLARWNTAMTLTHIATSVSRWHGAEGLKSHLIERIGDPTTVRELVDAVAMQVFGRTLPEQYRRHYEEYVADGGSPDASVDTHIIGKKAPSLMGLMLSSPHYQWR